MLVPTLNYFSKSSRCKLRYLSYCGTSLSMPLLRKLAAKPFIESCISFVSWSPLRVQLTKTFLRWRNKWPSLKAGSELYGRCSKISHLTCSSNVHVQAAARSHVLSCLLWTTDTISSHSLCTLDLRHTSQQSAWKFLLDENF